VNCDRTENSRCSTSGNGRQRFGREDRSMDYFAGLDISTDETHVCAFDREGMVVAKARRSRLRRRSPTNWPKRRVVVASYSKRGEWRRSCSTGRANSVCPWSAWKPVLAKTERRDNVAFRSEGRRFRPCTSGWRAMPDANRNALVKRPPIAAGLPRGVLSLEPTAEDAAIDIVVGAADADYISYSLVSTPAPLCIPR
jgi:hypothetical protein